MDKNINSNEKSGYLSSYAKNRYLLLIPFIILILGAGFWISTLVRKNRGLDKELRNLQLRYKYQPEENLFQWKEAEKLKLVYLSPSLLKTLSNDSFGRYTCLNFNDQRHSLNTIKESLGNINLEAGLEKIENYVFTTSFVDENQRPLPPLKAQYEISYTNICEVSENKYVVLFLTTQQKQGSSLLVPSVHAAGGWTGDSHMALIDNSEVKIYERFPFTANLIKLPKEEKEDVLLRFQAYYWCGETVAHTNKHIIINCSGNVYSFDYESEKFTELAICGNRLENGSYMTDKFQCYDELGSPYISY